ncbi:hypothetical protein L3Q82_012179, partial [Scortum barcoo]
HFDQIQCLSVDDSMSGASVSDVNDRLSALELRVQQQEDELTVMKAALADVLRRLAASEVSASSSVKKQHGGKGGAALREAYSMSCIANGGTSGRKRDSTSVTRKETVSSAAKSGADRKKETSSQRSQMEEIQEREEPPRPKNPSPRPSSPHPPMTPQTPQTPQTSQTPQQQRPALSIDSSKGHTPPKSPCLLRPFLSHLTCSGEGCLDWLNRHDPVTQVWEEQGLKENKQDCVSSRADLSGLLEILESPGDSWSLQEVLESSEVSWRGPSVKRSSGMERSQSSTWDSSEENKNKLVKAASTSKLLAKVVKNAERHKDPVVSQGKYIFILIIITKQRSAANELIMDFRKTHPPPHITGTTVERVKELQVPPVHIKSLSSNMFSSLCLSHLLEGNHIKMFMRGRPITMFIPSDVENYEDVRTELPSERLKLEWVYGYRGRDCRANVYLLPTGEIVYFIASVVALFNYEERTQRHYLGHTDCVKCLAIHPDKIRIATGQIAGVDKDGRALQPHVRIWDSVSLSTLQVVGLGTFERGVGSLAFSKADSGQHLSVIDDCNDHMLTVWDWQKKSKIAEIKTTNEVVLAVEFHPTDPNTIVTCGKSHIFFWTWTGTSLARKQGIFGKYEKPKFIQCLAFLSTGDILTGDSGGVLLVWTRSSAETPTGKGPRGEDEKWHFADWRRKRPKDHPVGPRTASRPCDIEVPDQYGTIRAVSEGKGDEFLVGTSRNFILRGTFNDGFLVEVQGHTDELWGLASHPSKDMFLTCAQDRLVCLWNSVDHSLQWSRTLEEHGHCADFHPSGAVVAIGTHSGKWYVLDAESTDLVAIHTDGNEQLSVMRFSVDGSLLAVGSHDNFIYLYTVSDRGRKYSRYGKCTVSLCVAEGSDGPNQCSDQIAQQEGIALAELLQFTCLTSTLSRVFSVALYVSNGSYLSAAVAAETSESRSECKDIDWATYTCVLGYHVFGVWPEGSDGTDINALIRSHNRKVLIALADDLLQAYLNFSDTDPQTLLFASGPSHKYSAHSSHVTQRQLPVQ